MSVAKWRWGDITYNDVVERTPLKIVSDALVANSMLADGRLLPVLLVDCTTRTDIEDLIKAHAHITPGDVKTQWGKSSKTSKTIQLILAFEKPSKCKAVLEFDILNQGGVVDRIMCCEALILQCGVEGERFKNTLDREKIVVEVPSKDTWSLWNEELFKALEDDAKRRGMSKKQAKEYASEVIKEWRQFGNHRMNKQ
jgi:hypothetical protein